MLISDEWRGLNAMLHAEREDFGAKVRPRLIRDLRDFMRKTGAKTVLDYGCGKGWLGRSIDSVRNYDPAIPEHAALPEPADIVVCWDVLEHVEPDYLGKVLDHARSLSLKGAHLVIATRPDSTKLMPDGRNPHLAVEPVEWWLSHLRERWNSLSGRFTGGEMEVRCQ